MVELLRTDDPVVLSYAAALLTDADVTHHLAGLHLNDGSGGEMQPRLLVAADQAGIARRLLVDAGVLEPPC